MSELSKLYDAIKELTSAVNTGNKHNIFGSTSVVAGAGFSAAIVGGLRNSQSTKPDSGKNKLPAGYDPWALCPANASKSLMESTKQWALKENVATKKKIDWMGKFTGILEKSTVALTGFAIAGLKGTVEGAKLSWAFQHLMYQIADLMRGPLRWLTANLGGLGLIIKKMQETAPGKSGAAAWGSGLGILNLFTAGLLFKGLAASFRYLWAAAMPLGTLMYQLGTLARSAMQTSAFIGRMSPWIGGAYAVYGAANWFTEAGRERNRISREAGRDETRLRDKSQTNPFSIGPGSAKYNDMIDQYYKMSGPTNAWGVPIYKKDEWAKKYVELSKQNGTEANKIEYAAKPEGKPKADDPNTPTYTTSFNSMESLWQNMNKMATENPSLAAEEIIASVIVKIWNWMQDRTWFGGGGEAAKIKLEDYK